MVAVDIYSRLAHHKRRLAEMNCCVVAAAVHMCQMVLLVARFSRRSLHSPRSELAPEVRKVYMSSAESVRGKGKKIREKKANNDQYCDKRRDETFVIVTITMRRAKLFLRCLCPMFSLSIFLFIIAFNYNQFMCM